VCAFQIEEYNNFYESKMNYKVSYMLMHSCCCILFLNGVDLIQTQRDLKINWKMNLETVLEKEKQKFHFSLSLPHFRPAGPFFSTGLPDFLFLPSLTSLLFQAEAQPNTDATLSPPFGRASPA
jgi:hypothetical protein